jgi:RimJ/RimL family protein N-acetyltransferase
MSDLESLVRFANNPAIARNMTDGFSSPYTSQNGTDFITLASRDTPPNILAIDIGGQASGGIGIHPQTDIHCKNAELGYWLAEPFWGQGIITEAIMEMVEYGFNNWNINRIFARPFGTNLASQKVLEKAGFILEGRFEKTLFKNGDYVDELIYAIRRSK